MLKFIKNNLPIFTLIIIVVGGFGYPFLTGKWIMAPKLSEIDSQCYGVDVPSNIEYQQVLHFCSCIHTVGMQTREEQYKYCTDRMNKITNRNPSI